MKWVTQLNLRQRIFIVLVAFDQLVLAVITFGYCKRNETMSAAAWALEQNGRLQGRIFRPLIDWLFTWIERDHCQASYLFENSMEKP